MIPFKSFFSFLSVQSFVELSVSVFWLGSVQEAARPTLIFEFFFSLVLNAVAKFLFTQEKRKGKLQVWVCTCTYVLNTQSALSARPLPSTLTIYSCPLHPRTPIFFERKKKHGFSNRARP